MSGQQPPYGQEPIDPRGAFSPPPPPPPGGQWGGAHGRTPPPPPPPMYGPPMYYPPPPPPRPHRSFTRAIFVTLAATIFGVSLLANLYLLMLLGFTSDRGDRQAKVREGDPTQKVALIPVSGLIMGDTVQRFERFISRAERDLDVKALVIEIDSPGGSIPASDAIHHRIKQFQASRPGVPVITSMGAVAASGGYYIACATDDIYAQPTTLTGHIGAVMLRLNLSELANRWGIEDTSIAATGSDFKTAGSILRAESEQERAYFQELVDEGFARFKQVVAEGREGRLTRPLEEIANGKVYLAVEAQELGLIDSIGYGEEAFQHAASLAGLNDPTVIRYLDPPTLRDLLRAESPVQLGNGGGITINGVNLNVDPAQIQELLTPRMMYLWRGD